MKKILVGVILLALLIACLAPAAQAWSRPSLQFSQGEKYQILQMFLMGDGYKGRYYLIVEKTPNNFETWHCDAEKIEIHIIEDESAYLVLREDIKAYSFERGLYNYSDSRVEIDVYLPLKFFIQGGEYSVVVGSRWTRERVYYTTATVYKET